jgi:peptide/nickel transport system substrate-binding protein
MKKLRLPIFLMVVLTLLTTVQFVGAQNMMYEEAPMLQAMVEAGELPPVEERLPLEPLVVEPNNEIGVYSDPGWSMADRTWNLGLRGSGDGGNMVRHVAYEGLVRWDTEWTQVIPNVAKGWEANEDGSEYTFSLREGMKWSDGAPFTAHDIVFWYEADATNTEASPSPPNWMVTGGEVGTVEAIDDHTVKFSFAAPNGLFMQRLATPDALQILQFPKHYAEQFHPDYNPDGIDALLEEAGMDNWVDLWDLKVNGSGNWSTPQPQLWAWTLENGYTADAVQVTAVRNPYYFKVDPEGRQYPYIDYTQWSVGVDVETLVLAALNGDIDFQDRHIAALSNKAVYFDNQEAGDYTFAETIPSSMNTAAIAFNLTHEDPVKREIFQNHDFRVALSIAIDRQSIIDLIYVGQGEVYQLAPRPTSPFYSEQLAKQHTEYDEALANQMLDEAGFAERDDDGYRLGPDGNRISFAVDVIPTLAPEQPDVVELVVGYWQAVGIDAQMNVVERTLFYERKDSNVHDVSVWGGDGGLDVVLEPRWYFPYSQESLFAEAWQYWYNGDPRGEEPNDIAKSQMALYDELKSTADPDAQAALMDEILQIAADEFWAMGINLPAPGYTIRRNNFQNTLASYPNAWLFPHPGPTNPFQYYIDGS